MTTQTPANTPNDPRSTPDGAPTSSPSQFLTPTSNSTQPTPQTPHGHLRYVAVILAVSAITGLEAYALTHGINGTALATATGALGTALGIALKK